MRNYVVGCLMAVLVTFCFGTAFAGERGEMVKPSFISTGNPPVEAPQTVTVKQPGVPPITREVGSVVGSVGNVAESAVEVVTAPVTRIFNTRPSESACAMAPYEVHVEYTPIQPQPWECTYCTCLPYGCPDGAPIVGVETGCNSCGVSTTGEASLCGGVFSTIGCLIGTVVCEPFIFADKILGCIIPGC